MVFLGFRGSVILVKSSRAKSRDLSCILVYRPMRDSGKGEPFSERSKKQRSARKISRCAPHDGVWGMGLFHVAYNGYVCESLFPYRHPDRSGGILLAYRYIALCEIAEKGKLSAEGARNDGVQGGFLDCARNDGIGGCITHVSYKGYVGITPFPQRHPDRSRGIFLAHRYSAVCVIAEKGKTFAKGARKSRAQGRFLDCTRNDGMGDGFISCSVQRICLESAIPVSSSRAKSRDLSGTPV